MIRIIYHGWTIYITLFSCWSRTRNPIRSRAAASVLQFSKMQTESHVGGQEDVPGVRDKILARPPAEVLSQTIVLIPVGILQLYEYTFFCSFRFNKCLLLVKKLSHRSTQDFRFPRDQLLVDTWHVHHCLPIKIKRFDIKIGHNFEVQYHKISTAHA